MVPGWFFTVPEGFFYGFSRLQVVFFMVFHVCDNNSGDDDDDGGGGGSFTCQAGWSMASPGFHQDGFCLPW